jgi:hypothetical protein
LLGVNTDADAQALKHIQQERHITWRSFVDGPPRGPIVNAWSIRAFPTIELIDAKGMVRLSFDGLPSDEELDGGIQQLLKEAETH